MKNPFANLEQNNEIQCLFSASIGDVTIPVASFIDDLLLWMEKPTSTYEPYARCIRESIGIGKNGIGADIDLIKEYLPRFEEIAKISIKKGSHFSKMILHESLAHRYADLWIANKNEKIETKMVETYKFAYDMAVKGNYIKNQDSSPYWLAKAYEKGGDTEKAYIHYKFILERKGYRFKQASHAEKILDARRFIKKYCSCFRSTIRDPFSLPNA